MDHARGLPAPPPAPDPATAPQKDGSGLTGVQLVFLMGSTLLAALIFLDLVSG